MCRFAEDMSQKMHCMLYQTCLFYQRDCLQRKCQNVMKKIPCMHMIEPRCENLATLCSTRLHFRDNLQLLNFTQKASHQKKLRMINAIEIFLSLLENQGLSHLSVLLNSCLVIYQLILWALSLKQSRRVFLRSHLNRCCSRDTMWACFARHFEKLSHH